MNILDRTADALKGHWIKGRGSDEYGNRCTLGHLNLVGDFDTKGYSEYINATTALRSVIAEQYPERLAVYEHPVVSFNDHPDTTEAEVLTVLEKASIKYDEVCR